MVHKSLAILILTVAIVLLFSVDPVAGRSDLEDSFANPPLSARPAAYWVWVNGLTNPQRLTYELEQMKAKGLSGVYIFDVGAQDPERIVPKGPAFMGPESLKAIGYAVREATRLGLEVGLITSSSWNCGGPWVKPEHASMGLYYCTTSVKGPADFSQVLPFPQIPKETPKGADGKPVYYKNVAVLATPEVGTGMAVDTSAIINLTDRLDGQGRLDWSVPAGTWTISRFVCANTGAKLRLPSPASDGLSIDHFNPQATKAHFDYLIDRLHQELGTFEQTALKQTYVCSYELSGSTWTPDFLREFQKRRGYDMTRYLPVLSGSTVGSPEITERFTYDYRKTLGELLVDAFYRTARQISNQHGLLLCAEAGGPGPPLHQVPVDALKALGAMDIPRGEFWKDHDVWVVKETACASHIYGKKIVDMESFTSWRHWQDGPFELKPLADRAMCDGTNHFTFHTSAHRPPEAGLPGWVYHAGTHVGPAVVWWPMARPFIDYLSRCSSMLQEGLFVADVCYYYGDQGFNFVPTKHVDPSLGYGYDYDVTNPEVILTRMSVDDGRLVLPDGMSYELLVLPDREDMDLEVLKKLEKLVEAGATVVGRKPTRCNGLTDYPHRDEKVRELANTIWGPCDGEKIKEHRYGKGAIIWGRSLSEILSSRGKGPDFGFTSRDGSGANLDCIHRRTKDADIYFVTNKDMDRQEVECTFRVSGKAPELWDPVSGQMREQLVYSIVEGGTKVPLRLPPAGSVFVVFRKTAKKNHVVSITRNSTEILPASPGAPQEYAPVEILPGERSDIELRVWQNGTCVLNTVDGKQLRAEVNGIPAAQEITGSWEVRFPPGWGAPALRVFPSLISWTQDSEDGVRYFSGIASYHKDFELSADQLADDKEIFLDLGRVRFVVHVHLNGKDLGILWAPPFRVDITHAARPGTNTLVVEVANTWSNRLTGDANSPKDQRYCRTNITKSLTWQVPWKDTPLLESGLLGPVRLVTARSVRLNLPE